MRRAAAPFVILTLLAAAATVPGPALPSAKQLPAPVTLDGVGGVFPGLSRTEVERRWGLPIRPQVGTAAPPCQAALVRKTPLDGYAIFIDGRFRAVFFRRGAVTGRGIRIGSTLAALRMAYGNLLSSRPNKYTPRARDYFVRRARSPHWELRFDVSPAGRVTQLAFGDAAVRLVEGCS